MYSRTETIPKVIVLPYQLNVTLTKMCAIIKGKLVLLSLASYLFMPGRGNLDLWNPLKDGAKRQVLLKNSGVNKGWGMNEPLPAGVTSLKYLFTCLS